MQEKSKTTCTTKHIKTTACQNINIKRNLDLKLEPDYGPLNCWKQNTSVYRSLPPLMKKKKIIRKGTTHLEAVIVSRMEI